MSPLKQYRFIIADKETKSKAKKPRLIVNSSDVDSLLHCHIHLSIILHHHIYSTPTQHPFLQLLAFSHLTSMMEMVIASSYVSQTPAVRGFRSVLSCSVPTSLHTLSRFYCPTNLSIHFLVEEGNPPQMYSGAVLQDPDCTALEAR